MFISIRRHIRHVALRTGSLAALLLAACGGGMGGYGAPGATAPMNTPTTTPAPMSCGAPSCGVAMVTLTDAKGDFLSYIVTLRSLHRPGLPEPDPPWSHRHRSRPGPPLQPRTFHALSFDGQLRVDPDIAGQHQLLRAPRTHHACVLAISTSTCPRPCRQIRTPGTENS